MRSLLKPLPFFFLFLLTSILTGSCKKYPDGPSISVIPKNWRLQGDWKTSKVLQNGKDITSAALANVSAEHKKIDRKGGFSYSLLTTNGSYISYAGTWSFSSDKTVVYFSYALYSGATTDQYLILRLEEHDLWLQNVNVQGDVMEYHYSPN